MQRVGRRAALAAICVVAGACGRSGLTGLVPKLSGSSQYCNASDATLVGCWTFEGTVADLSGAGNQPTIVGSTSYAPAIDGGALVSSGATMVWIPDSPTLDLSTALTIEMWLNPSTRPTGGNVATIYDDDGQYAIEWHSNGDLQFIWVGVNNSGVTLQGDRLPPGTWTHLAVTWAGGNWTYFVDGQGVGTRFAPGRLATNGTNGSRIAGNSPSGQTYLGEIDDLRIFRRALPPATICSDAGAC